MVLPGAVGKYAKEDFLRKYLTISFFVSNLSRLIVNVLEANN